MAIKGKEGKYAIWLSLLVTKIMLLVIDVVTTKLPESRILHGRCKLLCKQLPFNLQAVVKLDKSATQTGNREHLRQSKSYAF